MDSKIKNITVILGVAAVFLGIFHGYYEIQQGNVAPSDIFINAVGGTECVPNCFPAMTIIPNFLFAGITTIVIGLVMLLWVFIRLNDKKGGIGFVILSIGFLLAGGGFGAPILSALAGIIVILKDKS